MASQKPITNCYLLLEIYTTFAFVIQVADDPVFTRDGADVYVDSNISFTQVRICSMQNTNYCI